ncbi:PREDICTED: chemokine-like receptor 1 [Gekko japonicus]|uniref:Chemokine-like receptor 1 n=1 Tax=Gekko japonicus TaxID=146911 RepID=A0ABM1LBJ6_GEKJA|nr:PREDICTED: chemokine-like receptor 1 [Gekko japonicus]
MDLLTTFPNYATESPLSDNAEFPPSSDTEFYNSWNESWASEPFYNSAQIHQVMKIVSMVIYSITLVLGATGNGLVIFLTGFLMKKTVTTIWYLNLAVADFVFALSLSSEIAYLALDYHWTLGRLMCKLDSMVTFLNMFASVFFLTAISADRCVSVMFPVWALNHRTLELASLVAGCIWTAALALSLPYLSFRDTKYLPDGSIWCIYNFGSEDDGGLRTQQHFSVVMTEFTVGFVIPFTVILACYCAIVIKLRRSLFSRSSRSVKIIVAVIQVFFCSWFPYHLFSILEILGEDSLGMQKTLDIGAPVAHGLFCLNSCLNPLLYTFVGTGCKAASGRSFLSSFKGAFSEKWVPHTLSRSRNSSSASAVESTMV